MLPCHQRSFKTKILTIFNLHKNKLCLNRTISLQCTSVYIVKYWWRVLQEVYGSLNKPRNVFIKWHNTQNTHGFFIHIKYAKRPQKCFTKTVKHWTVVILSLVSPSCWASYIAPHHRLFISKVVSVSLQHNVPQSSDCLQCSE